MSKGQQKQGMKYKDTGVSYDDMDPFKRMCQLAARTTAHNLERFGFKEVEWTRGESVYLIKTPFGYLAHVEEGLGTKNKAAETMQMLQNILELWYPELSEKRKTYYDQIAQCGVAMIVNDMITLGAMPVSVAMHMAVGSSELFKDEQACQDLADGWAKACELARCTWGCGETPTLPGIICPGTLSLSGSAMGVIQSEDRLIKCNIQDGDAIILVLSSGIHANGLSLGREIGERLPKKYLTVLDDGRTYGETLLEPTIIYVPLVDDCLSGGVDIHYAVNITGHGWRKLMRAPGSFQYHIEIIPEPDPIFRTIQKFGPVDDYEAYGNLNMNAGFALYVPYKDVNKTIAIALKNGMKAMHAGTINQMQDGKEVFIEPKNITYEGKTLTIR